MFLGMVRCSDSMLLLIKHRFRFRDYVRFVQQIQTQHSQRRYGSSYFRYVYVIIVGHDHFRNIGKLSSQDESAHL